MVKMANFIIYIYICIYIYIYTHTYIYICYWNFLKEKIELLAKVTQWEVCRGERQGHICLNQIPYILDCSTLLMNWGKLQIAVETHTYISSFILCRKEHCNSCFLVPYINLEQTINFQDLRSHSLTVLTPMPPSSQMLKITSFGYVFIHIVALQEQRHCTMLSSFCFLCSSFFFKKNLNQSWFCGRWFHCYSLCQS